MEGSPVATNPIDVVYGSGDAEILSGVTGNDWTVKAGIYLVELDGSFTGANNSLFRFALRKASDDSVLATSTSPSFRQGSARMKIVLSVLHLDADTAINIQLLRTNASSLDANWTLTFNRMSGVKGDPGSGGGGSGLPDGGTDGQVLTKASSTDGDADWEDPATSVPDGGSKDQVLAKKSATDGDTQWVDAAPSNAEQNVQADWTETDTSDDAYIENKPTLGDAAAKDVGGANGVAGLNAQGTLFSSYFPSYIATDTEVTAAVEALKGGAPASMDTLKELADAIGLRLRYRGSYGSTTSDYVAQDIVTHKGATYMALTNVPAGTEPGVDSDWKTNWWRIGYFDGPPNALIGADLTGSVLKFTRESGENPISINLPSGGGGSTPQDPVVLHNASFTPATTHEQYKAVDFTTDDEWDDFDYIEVTYAIRVNALLTATIPKETLERLTVKTAGSLWYQGGSIARPPATFLVDQGGDGLAIGVSSDKGQLLIGDTRSSGTSANVLLIRGINRPGAGPKGDKGDTGAAGPSGGLKPVKIGSANISSISTTNRWLDTGITLPTPADADELWFMSFGDESMAGRIFLASQMPTTAETTNNLESVSAQDPGVVLLPSVAGARRPIKFARSTNSATENKLLYAVSAGTTTPVPLVLYRFVDQGGGGSVTPPPAVTNPQVTNFEATDGELAPPAGSIAGQHLTVAWTVAQSSHLTALRIVGFKGTDAAPSSVTEIETLPSATYAHGSARIAVPVGVTLAADETYTFRLEAYGAGQTVATDQPVSYQDIRITAHAAATANYHVGYIEWKTADGDRAAGTVPLARLTNFDNDTDTAVSIPSSMEIDVPEDSKEYYIYLACKADQTQPTGFTSNGLGATGSFYDAQTKSIGGVSYKFYILRATWRVTHDNNGDTFGITS